MLAAADECVRFTVQHTPLKRGDFFRVRELLPTFGGDLLLGLENRIPP